LPQISCHAVPHLDEVTAVYCHPTARHIEKLSNTNALEWVTLDGKNFEDFVEEIIEKLNEESEKLIVLGRFFFSQITSLMMRVKIKRPKNISFSLGCAESLKLSHQVP
jgi:hypothetical protein